MTIKLYLALLLCFWSSVLFAQSLDLKNGQDAKPSTLAMPDFQQFQTDPDTGLQVWRLGGSAEEMQSIVPYPNGAEAVTILQAQHFYSRTSPTNLSETYALSASSAKQPYAALWHLPTHKLVAWVPAAKETHIQQRQLLWDKNLDNVYWYTQNNQLIRAEIDFKTLQVRSELWDTFSDFDYVTFGWGEGNFSDKGEKLVLSGRDQRTDTLYFQPYLVQSKTKLPRRAVEPEVNWAGVDPKGEYIVFDQHQPNTRTVSVPFEKADQAIPTELYPHLKHSDFVLDQHNDAWIVYGDWRGLMASRVKDGVLKKLWPMESTELNIEPNITLSGHVARVPKRTGTVLISRHYDGGLYLFNIDKPSTLHYVGNSRHGRGAVGAKTKQQAQRWGVTADGEVTFYKREARGAVSPSGRYVFFTSDYQSYATSTGGYEPEPELCKAYLNMIEVPESTDEVLQP